MKVPLFQVTLNTRTLEEAAVAASYVRAVDFLGVGESLCLHEGLRAIETIGTFHPEQRLVADVKLSGAEGRTLVQSFFSCGASRVTVSWGAPLRQIERMRSTAVAKGGDIQIVLSRGWTYEALTPLKEEIGVREFIYQRDQKKTGFPVVWNHEDLLAVGALLERGFLVSLQNVSVESDVTIFRDLPLSSLVVEVASLREAKRLASRVALLREEVRRLWKDDLSSPGAECAVQ